MRLVIVGFVAAITFGGGRAKADFTFGEPTNLGPAVNTTYGETSPSLSADGLTLYFRSKRTGGYGDRDIWVATRQTVNDPWGEAVNLGPNVNTEHVETNPVISADGLTLYFYSNRPGGYGGHDLWVTTRETIDDSWSEPVNLGPVVNSPYKEGGPSISFDALTLYFYSDRPGGLGLNDLWVTTRATINDPWGVPVNLGPSINSSGWDARPSISDDGLWLFFDSSRSGGYGQLDLYVTTRTSVSDSWGEPVNLGPIVNSSAYEESATISADGSTLFFDSKRAGGVGDWDIWQASIIPIVDLNDDGIVDAQDMCIVVDHWGTDEPLCDIGPMPWGDGIVDVQDLIVLAEHLFGEFPPTE
jgi:Tol biopolymer transport system component